MRWRNLFQLSIWGWMIFSVYPNAAYALESSFAGNYAMPELQSGFLEEEYEVEAGRKFLRGAENFLLGWLEVPHGVKMEVIERKREYLPVGVERVLLGVLRGFLGGIQRTGVGLYEMFTFLYPQEPILTEMDQWLY